MQAVIVALLAALLGVVLRCCWPAVPDAGGHPDGGFVCCRSLAVAIGLLASLAGLRRAVAVDPALAFGGP